jgi:hypothetical protein
MFYSDSFPSYFDPSIFYWPLFVFTRKILRERSSQDRNISAVLYSIQVVGMYTCYALLLRLFYEPERPEAYVILGHVFGRYGANSVVSDVGDAIMCGNMII